MEKITGLFSGHKKEEEEVKPAGHVQETKHEDGEKKGLFGIGGHKKEESEEGKHEKTGLFGHKKDNSSSSSSSSESESEEGIERQRRRKERKEKKRAAQAI